MSSSVSITTALCLAASDVETLIQGRMIAAISRTFINAIPHFALCPADISDDDQTVTIQAWARLESCKIYSDSVELEKLAQLTTWSNQNLQNLLQERCKIFLAYLRVYRLPQTVEIPAERINSDKVGSFIRLPSTLAATTADPVLNDALFQQRYQQLVNLEVPQHPELEKLHNELINLNSSKETKFLLNDLKIFLGWLSEQSKTNLDPDLTWIKTIDALGRRTLEEDSKAKSSWQAGTDFENVVRRSLEFLGFKVDYSHRGGAGGIDIFCSEPYPLVGECKSGKKIPNDTAVQLLNLGTLRLKDTETFSHAAKLIIGPGVPTEQLREASKVHNMAILKPITLEKLVELNCKCPVDLFKLKKYLIAGQSDEEVENFIEQSMQEITLRSYIVNLVKRFLENSSDSDAGLSELRAIYINSNPPKVLRREEMHEILIELSSPLTGYLGRRKATDGSDRFYFLRELHVD